MTYTEEILSNNDRIKKFENKFSLDDLHLLLSHISIYRGSYNIEVGKKYERKWIHINKYLDDYRLLCSINSGRKNKSTIAYSSTYQTNFFVLDLDFHPKFLDNHTIAVGNTMYDLYSFGSRNYLSTQDKLNILKRNFIDKKYAEIKKLFGVASLACSTPHGVHLYYFLKQKINVDYLHDLIKNKLNNMECVDIKPGIDSFIRSINKQKLLYTYDLHIYARTTKFSTIINRGHIYDVYEIFDNFNIETKVKTSSFKENPDYETIYAGHTNDALNYLIPLWKNHGYSEKECYDMFKDRLDSSYRGDVLHNLEKRIAFFDKHNSNSNSNNSITKKYNESITKAVQISNHLISNSYNRKKREQSIIKLMTVILTAKESSENILESKRNYYKHCEQNPYFSYNMKQGFIPISSALLKRAVPNYTSTLKYLKSIGFITKATSYSVSQKSCIYYKINIDFYNNTNKNINKDNNTNDNNIKTKTNQYKTKTTLNILIFTPREINVLNCFTSKIGEARRIWKIPFE